MIFIAITLLTKSDLEQMIESRQKYKLVLYSKTSMLQIQK